MINIHKKEKKISTRTNELAFFISVWKDLQQGYGHYRNNTWTAIQMLKGQQLGG
jgi:uncharacterized protein (DUF3084 family)